LQNPKAPSPRPENIKTAVTNLEAIVKQKKYEQKHKQAADGVWANAEAGFKLMTTKLASMETLYANTKKALRSTEQTDAGVKLDLENAADDIKTAPNSTQKPNRCMRPGCPATKPLSRRSSIRFGL
jgi:hypothetical protein